MKGHDMVARAGVVALGSMLIIGAMVGVWATLRNLSADVLAALVLIAGLALPVVAWMARRWGLAEARGALEGMKAGSEAATAITRATSDIRVRAAERLRRRPEDSPAALVLPLPPASIARSGEKVIDL